MTDPRTVVSGTGVAPPSDPATADAAAASAQHPDDGRLSHAADRSRWQRWREKRRTRVTKWDRPPPPKDWRYFVGTTGKVLVSSGLLMFGFVAYQLWGTGIETARAQSELRGEFEEQIAAATGDEIDGDAVGIDNWVVPVDDPDETTRPDATLASDDIDDEAPTDDDPDATTADTPTDTPGTADPEPDSAPAIGPPSELVPGGIDLSELAIHQNVPIVRGDAFARIEIPRIGTSHHVVPGVTVDDLKKGPGHYPGTPLPGQLGNASIAGHRTTYGAPFFDLDQLRSGDEIVVTVVTGDTFVYRVTGLEVVSASDGWVIATRDPNVAELTLTTCEPKYTARDRLIVHSVLVPEKSAQVGFAELYDLTALTDVAPGDDPTVVTTPTTAPTTEPSEPSTTDPTDVEPANASVEPAVDATDATPAEPTDAADTTPAIAEPDGSDTDAFGQGWFDDRGAFPQIAMWGTALTLISMLAYQVSKKTRHDSIGFLVGIAPFMVALYFFFQNINRLLPPGL